MDSKRGLDDEQDTQAIKPSSMMECMMESMTPTTTICVKVRPSLESSPTSLKPSCLPLLRRLVCLRGVQKKPLSFFSAYDLL